MKKETIQKAIEWTAAIIAITGAILNAFLMKEGFYLWIVSNTIFVYFAYKNKHWGLALTFFVYLIISTIGIIYW
jgi:nicotinamide riboside transporter PnuC